MSASVAMPMVIVIDPGHGGEPGVIGPDGARECDITLAMADALVDALKCAGQELVMQTRTGDYAVEADTRQARAAAWGARVVVSLHLYGGTTADQGIWVAWHGEENRRLAEPVLRALATAFPGRVQGWDDPNLTARVPTLLINMECISNPERCKELQSPTFRATMARALALGLTKR